MASGDRGLIGSLRAAVDAAPDDVPLRLHLAELLIDAGEQGEAVTQVASALQREPGSAAGRELMSRALGESQTERPEAPGTDFDWRQAEEQVGDGCRPRRR